MIIGLAGFAGSGKDAAAKFLVEHHEFARLAFADKLKDLVLEINPEVSTGEVVHGILMPTVIRIEDVVNHLGWDEAKKLPDVRSLLQTFGEGCRAVLGEDVWIEALDKEHWAMLDDAQFNEEYFDCATRAVFTDVRYPNEVDFIHSRGGRVLWVSRPGNQAVNSHISEHALLETQLDGEILNDGSLEQLKETMAGLVEMIGA